MHYRLRGSGIQKQQGLNLNTLVSQYHRHKNTIALDGDGGFQLFLIGKLFFYLFCGFFFSGLLQFQLHLAAPFTFQFFQLLPTLTILENIVLPMDFCNMYRRRERKERALCLLEQVGIVDQAHKLPSALSGGQQQRAAIARALANDPPVIVADEPTGNLDTATADEVFKLFQGLVSRGKTLLVVTHDQRLSARTWRVLHLLDGRIHRDHNNGNGKGVPEGSLAPALAGSVV